jgi:putative acetyltransferase
MAVLPAHQRQGVGSLLVRAGLEACRAAGHGCVVVLGHPAYYPRFGFAPASRHGVAWEHPVPDEAFMLLELRPGALGGRGGIVRYQPEFGRA